MVCGYNIVARLPLCIIYSGLCHLVQHYNYNIVMIYVRHIIVCILFVNSTV